MLKAGRLRVEVLEGSGDVLEAGGRVFYRGLKILPAGGQC